MDGKIFVSNKFNSGKKCLFEGIELEYGINAFKSIDEIPEPFFGEIVFLDSKTAFDEKIFNKFEDCSIVLGNTNIESEEPVVAKNSLTIDNTDYDGKLYSKHFANVKINNSDTYSIDFSKHNTYTEKIVYGKKETDEYDNITRKVTITQTDKADGSFTAQNSYVGEINNYKTVNLLNSSAGHIENNCGKTIITVFQDQMEDEWNDNFTDTISEHIATGSVTIKADNKFQGDSRLIDIGYISGYQNITVAGYKDKKNSANDVEIETGSLVGGSEIDGVLNVSSGSANISNGVTVKGYIAGFTNVTLTNSTVNDIIQRGDSLGSSKTSSKKSSYKDEWLQSESVKKIMTTSYKNDGKFTATASLVGGEIDNFGTVTLTNSSAGNISRNSLEKIEDTVYEERYKDLDSNEWSPWESFEGGQTYYERSLGNVTVKSDKDGYKYSQFDDATGKNVFSVGNIDNYLNVTLTGYTDKKDAGKNVIISAGSISGGDRKYSDYYYGYDDSVSGSVKLTDAHSGRIDKFNSVQATNAFVDGSISACQSYNDEDTWFGSWVNEHPTSESFDNYFNNETVKSADKVVVKNSEITGGIYGYKTVTVTDACIHEDIDLGVAYESKYKEKNGNTYSMEMSYKTTAAGSFTAKNASAGSVYGYNKITIVNTNIADAVNWVENYSATYKVKETSDDYKLLTDTGKWERKASGSFSATVDKNATYENYTLGNISGFDKVTLSGFSKNEKNKYLKVGDISGGKWQKEGKTDGGFWNDYINFSELEKNKIYSSGSVTISTNVVAGDIIGFGKVSITNAQADSIVGYADSNFDGSWNTTVSGHSVTLNGAKVGSVYEYGVVTFSGKYNEVGTISDGMNIKIAADATVKIDSLSFADFESAIPSFVLDGTLIWNGSGSLGHLSAISGKGKIAVTDSNKESIETVLQDSNIDFDRFINLGATAEGFRGEKQELADNKEKNATRWNVCADGTINDQTFVGWLSGEDVEIYDNVDWIAFNTDNFDSEVELSLAGAEVNMTVYKVDSKGKTTELETDSPRFYLGVNQDYLIKLEWEGDNSTTYTLALNQ